MLNGNQNWSLLSSHGVILICLATRPDSTLRDIAQRVNVTERTVFTVIQDLMAAEMVRMRKIGRRNSYTVNSDAHLIHPALSHLKLGPFLEALMGRTPAQAELTQRLSA